MSTTDDDPLDNPPSCIGCRFSSFDGTDEGAETGLTCRYSPPVIFHSGFDDDGQPNFFTEWPAVKSDEWCGCYEANE